VFHGVCHLVFVVLSSNVGHGSVRASTIENQGVRLVARTPPPTLDAKHLWSESGGFVLTVVLHCVLFELSLAFDFMSFLSNLWRVRGVMLSSFYSDS